MAEDSVVIIGGARTPFGGFGAGLKDYSATELGVAAVQAALRSCGVSPQQVGHVIMGNVAQTSVDAIYLALPNSNEQVCSRRQMLAALIASAPRTTSRCLPPT